jgi:hypothetical protein
MTLRPTQVTSRVEPITDAPALDGPSGGSALVVEHLSKRFGDRIAFDDVSFGPTRERTPDVAATLHLIREKGVVMELRRGTFRVLLDGKDVGSIDMHGTIEVPIEPGHHTLQVKAGRYTSSRRSFDAADGSIINFRCNGAVIWPVYLASLVKPDLALRLTHE